MMSGNADMKPTLDSDIAAFQHKHALDSTQQRVVAEGIVVTRHLFEIFAFNSPDIGECIFDVRGIKDALASRKLEFAMLEMTLDQDFVDHVREHQGVETRRMEQLTAEDLERPGIFVHWPNGYSTLIDGNNRVVRRWDVGLRTFRAAILIASKRLLPYICDPGQEDQFLDRDRDPNMESVLSVKIGRVTW